MSSSFSPDLGCGASDGKVWVTGASGFLGQVLMRRLAADGLNPIGLSRSRRMPGDNAVSWVQIQGYHALDDILSSGSVLVHLAARVHVMREESQDPLAAFREANVNTTLAVAKSAAAAGVRRFIFVSSIKVNGEQTQPGSRFKPDDKPAPIDAYGVSKMEAEKALMDIGLQTGMEIVIIRPPLIYGPGVKANFAAMLRWLRRGVPLPLGAIHNRRSLVAVDNLVDLILTCIHHPAAANEIFLVSDGEDVSTTELLRRLALAMHRSARLLPIPASCLRFAARLVGRQDVAQRLLASLQVDMTKTTRLLGWTPPLTLDQGLRAAVQIR